MKKDRVANFHGEASDAYAYAWMVQGSLFSWITLWHLCHKLNRCKVAYFIATGVLCVWVLTETYGI